MRLNRRPSVCAMVRTISVFAVPGRPVIRQWPPANSAIRICSSTSSWPTMTEWTCPRISSRTVRKRSMRPLSSAESRVTSAAGVAMVDSSYRWNATRHTWSVTPLRCRVFDLEEELLRGAKARRRFQRSEHGLFGLVELVGREVRLREIVERAGLVERVQGHDRGVLAHRARVVLLLQPQG